MVLWEIRYRPNFDGYICCYDCGVFFAFMRCLASQRSDEGLWFYRFHPLFVVNVDRAGDTEYRCVCGSLVAFFVDDFVEFRRYLHCMPSDVGANDGLTNEVKPQSTRGDNLHLIWGCSVCWRPIYFGTVGRDFIIDPLYLANVGVYANDVRRILCRCGNYVGFLNSFDQACVFDLMRLYDAYRPFVNDIDG